MVSSDFYRIISGVTICWATSIIVYFKILITNRTLDIQLHSLSSFIVRPRYPPKSKLVRPELALLQLCFSLLLPVYRYLFESFEIYRQRRPVHFYKIFNYKQVPVFCIWWIWGQSGQVASYSSPATLSTSLVSVDQSAHETILDSCIN